MGTAQVAGSHLFGTAYEKEAVPGLVWAYHCKASSTPRLLKANEVEALLNDADGWLWLHFHLADTHARTWIVDHSGLSFEAAAHFTDGDDAVRFRARGRDMVGACPDFHLDIGGPAMDIGRLRFAVTETLVITGRKHELCAVEDMRKNIDGGRIPASPAELIELLIEGFCATTTARASQLDAELDSIEDHVLADALGNERRRLVPIRRAAVILHRQLSQLSGAARELQRQSALPLAAPLLINASRIVATIDLVNREIAMVLERARLMQDEIGAKLAEETNRSLRILAVISALLLPGSLTASILGMNVGGLPMADNPGGFAIAILLCLIATAAFYYVIHRLSGGVKL